MNRLAIPCVMSCLTFAALSCTTSRPMRQDADPSAEVALFYWYARAVRLTIPSRSRTPARDRTQTRSPHYPSDIRIVDRGIPT